MAKEYTDTEICLKCVDENEILYDESGKYLDKITSTKLDCRDTLYEDILKNLSQCKEVVLMSLKQRIIMKESGVRLNARNDIAGMQAKIAAINLPTECKNHLRDISSQGYKILKQNNFFDYLVEFDAERSAKVKIFGQQVNAVGSFDMLAIMDDIPLTGSNSQQTKPDNPSRKKHDTENEEKDNSNNDAEERDKDSSDISMTDTVSEATISTRSLGKAVVTIIVTARKYINVTDIFRQFLFMYLQNLSRFFFLVFHVGPLVDKQEIVLYEYKPPKTLVKLVKSYQATEQKQNQAGNEQIETRKQDNENRNNLSTVHTEFVVSQTVQKSKILGPADIQEVVIESPDLNVSQLELEFRKVKGRHLQQVAPLKDYFRYMVYDCPGVKDHQRDNKARYERYTAKQEKKREEKLAKLAKSRKEAEETECRKEPTFTFESNKAVFGSTCLPNDQYESPDNDNIAR